MFGLFFGLITWDVAIGIISGVLFGGLSAIFVVAMARNVPDTVKSIPGETITKTGLANHYVGIEAVGGYLVLTDRRLHHIPHALNIQSTPVSCPLSAITDVRTGWNFIMPNAVIITLQDGRSERFVVNGRKEWAAAISRQLQAAPPADTPQP